GASQINAQALELLGGENPQRELAPLRAQQRKELHELEILKQAHAIQTERIRHLVTPASRAVCRALLPEHKKLAQRLDKAVRELKAASDAMYAFRHALAFDGVKLVEPIETCYFLSEEKVQHAFELWENEKPSYV
ncbi:unnamed protein product, partial [marine sediment metagenome]